MSSSTAAGPQKLACLNFLHAFEPSSDQLLLLPPPLMARTFTWLKSEEGADAEGSLEMAVES